MLAIVATCLNDLYQGSNRPTLAVMVCQCMTKEEFMVSLKEQYNADEFFPEVDQSVFDQLAEQLEDLPFNHLDESTNTFEFEPVYAYVSLIT
jgi:hypothetical protein